MYLLARECMRSGNVEEKRLDLDGLGSGGLDDGFFFVVLFDCCIG
jgi:hypothetical protein